MTCYYSTADWRDVLYTSVCNTDGGVVDAARYLTERRGKAIHPEVLRTRLRHKDGQSISIEMAEMLSEWMETKACGQDHALDWLHALNGRFGMTARLNGDVDTDDEDPVQHIQATIIKKAVEYGRLAKEVTEAIADRRISLQEADAIEAAGRRNQRHTEDIIQAARRAVGKSL